MNPEHENSVAKPALLPGWNRPLPEHAPEPTVWPAALSLGITLMLWGLVSSFFITAIGAVLFAWALVGWIGDIRHERQQHE